MGPKIWLKAYMEENLRGGSCRLFQKQDSDGEQ